MNNFNYSKVQLVLNTFKDIEATGTEPKIDRENYIKYKNMFSTDVWYEFELYLISSDASRLNEERFKKLNDILNDSN